MRTAGGTAEELDDLAVEDDIVDRFGKTEVSQHAVLGTVCQGFLLGKGLECQSQIRYGRSLHAGLDTAALI